MPRFHITEWNTPEAWRIAAANEERLCRIAAGEKRIRELNLLRDTVVTAVLNICPEPDTIIIELPQTATAERLDKVA